jgi:hypothetical protein
MSGGALSECSTERDDAAYTQLAWTSAVESLQCQLPRCLADIVAVYALPSYRYRLRNAALAHFDETVGTLVTQYAHSERRELLYDAQQARVYGRRQAVRLCELRPNMWFKHGALTVNYYGRRLPINEWCRVYSAQIIHKEDLSAMQHKWFGPAPHLRIEYLSESSHFYSGEALSTKRAYTWYLCGDGTDRLSPRVATCMKYDIPIDTVTMTR